MTWRRTARSIKGACAVAGMVAMLAGATALTGLAATTAIDAQGNKQGGKPAKDKDHKGKAKNGRDHETNVVVVVDLDGHRRIVRDYVSRGSLPPGLAKRRALPPGLSRQLRENGALPPGLRDYFIEVPSDWRARFPVVPVYYTRYFVGRDLIIIDTRNDVIVSLIRDLLD